MRFSSLATQIRDRVRTLFRSSSDSRPLVSHKHEVTLLKQLRGKRMPSFRQWKRFSRLLSPREKQLFRVAVLVLIFSTAWFAYSFLSVYQTVVPAAGGRYVEAVVGSPQRINPLFAPVNDTDVDVTRLVYSGLMRYDAEQRLVPDLATKYEVSEDKKTYTFYLRENATWHDGTPFTADDVVYTIETIQNPSVNSPLLLSFQGVLVEKINEYTVSFTLPEPYPSFASSLTVGMLPEHIWLDIPAEQIRLSQKNIQPIGTGPYQFKKLIKDDRGQILRYELERYEEWYRQLPYIEEFVFAFYGSYAGPGGAIQDLREKKVDGLHFVPYDLRDQVERKHLNLYTLQLPQYTALMFNQESNEILAKKDVRTALAYALDKDRILRETLENEGQLIYSPVLPGFPGYDPEIEKTPYTIIAANELLDKSYDRLDTADYREQLIEEEIAHYQETQTDAATSTEQVDTAEQSEESTESNTTDEEDTSENADIPEDVMTQIEEAVDARIDPAQPFYRVDEDGNILTLRLVTSETAEYSQAARLVAGMWQELGIRTDISLVQAKEISRQVLKERNYDVLLYGMIVGEDPDQYPFWHSSQKAFPGLNLSQYENSEVDTILEQARETTDVEKEAELYRQFQEKLLADVPAIFLYMPTYTYVLSDEVKGFEVVRISHPADRFNDVASWYVDTKYTWDFV